MLTTQPPPPAFLFLAHTLAWPQEDELEVRAAKINQLGRQVASEGRQRAEERRGRTEAERRLRAEKQVSAHAACCGLTLDWHVPAQGFTTGEDRLPLEVEH